MIEALRRAPGDPPVRWPFRCDRHGRQIALLDRRPVCWPCRVEAKAVMVEKRPK